MGLRFDSKCDFTSPTVFLGLHLCPWTSFFWVRSNILLLIFVQQLVVILVFSQEKMSAPPSTPPSNSVAHYIGAVFFTLWGVTH